MGWLADTDILDWLDCCSIYIQRSGFTKYHNQEKKKIDPDLNDHDADWWTNTSIYWCFLKFCFSYKLSFWYFTSLISKSIAKTGGKTPQVLACPVYLYTLVFKSRIPMNFSNSTSPFIQIQDHERPIPELKKDLATLNKKRKHEQSLQHMVSVMWFEGCSCTQVHFLSCLYTPRWR